MPAADRDGTEVQQASQPQRWRSRMNAHSSISSNQTTEDGQGDNGVQSQRQSISAPNTGNANAHRQIIGNYELGRVLATGDFDCRTRICTHVTTGVPYVVRIYDKHVLAEAQWMWDRVAESIHVQRKLPHNRHILEMVECFESNTSVYILMHLFPSMNLTKLFTDMAAQAELMNHLHFLSRAAVRASVAERESHFTSGPEKSKDQEGDERRGSSSGAVNANSFNENSSFTSVTMAERASLRQLQDGRPGIGGVFDMPEPERNQRTPPTSPGDEKRGSVSVFPDTLKSASVTTAAAIHALEGPIPPHVPLPLIRVLFEQVVKGVFFLHQHGVAHTGIAPDHLLVSPEGLVRIGNMVSSCFCAPGDRLHALRGTMHTVAPEVLRSEAYDPFMADAWALGVVFYFMLNRGRYPHDGANTLRHILHGHTRQPRPGLPAVALDLLSRLMQVKPEDRLPVDAILAHPFFTATLPTVAEEVLADAADAQARSGHRSVYTGYNASLQGITDSRVNKTPVNDPLTSSHSGSFSNNRVCAGRDGSGGARRWGREAGANEESDTLAGSWSTPHQHPSSTPFSTNIESNSVVVASGLSSTFDNPEGTTALPGAGEQLGTTRSSSSAGGGRGGGVDTLDNGSFFIPQRHTTSPDGRPPRLPAPLPTPPTPRNPSNTAKSRPVWRPELATSMDDLEDLAARLIQHHFRAALYRRLYRAETRALMQRGQSMYLSSASSSSRDGLSASPQTARTAAVAADATPTRSLLHSRRMSSSSLHASVLGDGTSVSPTKPQRPFHGRVSTTRSPPTNMTPSNLTPSARKRKTSFLKSDENTLPAATAASAPSFHSPQGRRPSAVAFSAAADAGAMSSSRGRFDSSSVTIDTRSGLQSGNATEEDDERIRTGGSDEETSERHDRFLDEDAFRRTTAVGRCSVRLGEEAGARTDGEDLLRRDSSTLPSLAATACGTGLANEAPFPLQPPPLQFPSRGSGGCSSNRMLNSMANASLLSQQGRRRSSITAVISSVASHRTSFDPQRNAGCAVSDGEVCPLCHREPYAVRSIAIRPYASTPYQFTSGEFTKLLE
ncbi:hypothetical protein ABB37_00117 [Leptomonas pyrrhocoris]|uniref:Protein kinase domain-containing protein n=1 Tax=Leptomonas pyrrhocoris TaxID=157538 RepID=A0A0N0VHM7_LEPPY|nr:hypothetical protein ABB37_00117 [Leptomonas pyrrhocoris]KPA85761.1 hypothetical protein ABB37_00117 [Leptomonas pyrrhocoris]|eukprot:XP_015664200.1 hypothetical protein ABB37_00117 [Leptomonas pyrrhocoris]